MSGINIPVTVTGADTAATQLGKVSTSLGGVAKASNTAGQSLVNLGRIVQDAPFGFVAIQNNINPLIESFGRLKAETGGSGAAFLALGKSLLGVGGIGLGVSIVTSLLTKLSNDGFFKAGESAKKADERAKEYAQTLNNVFNSVGKEGAQTLSLIAILENENETRDRKLAVLKQLNEINPQVFKGIKLEESGVVGLTAAYDAYLETLKRTAVANIFKARLEKEVAKLVQLSGEDRTIAEKQTRKTVQYYLDIGDAASNAKKKIGEGILGPVAQQRAKIEDIKNSLKQVSDVLDVTLGKSGKGGKGEKNQKVKEIETVASTIAALREKLIVLNKEEITFNVDKSKEKIKEIENTISKLFVKFKLTPEAPKVQRLKSLIRDIEADEGNKIILGIDVRADLKETTNAFRELGKKNAAKIEPIIVPFNLRTSEREKELREYYNRLAKVAQEQQDIFLNAVVESFTAIGEGLGNIITGKAGFGELFAGIGQIFGNALKELGKSVIIASELIASIKNALNTAFKGNPILGVIAGVALIALGTVIQNSLPKFANGVTNFGGGMALVGERGPEIVRLPSGSDVIPNFRLNSMKASSPMAYIPNVTLRGSDLIIAIQRQAATNSRSGGGGNGWFFYGDSKPGK